MSDLGETKKWHEYSIKCSLGTEHPIYNGSTVRAKALAAMDKIARPGERRTACPGAHALMQRLVTRTNGIWEPLRDTDIQSGERQALFDKAESIECPKCHAAAGTPCMNLKTPTQNTAWPHAERINQSNGGGAR